MDRFGALRQNVSVSETNKSLSKVTTKTEALKMKRKTALVAATAITMGLVFAMAAPAQVTSGLVSRWIFDQTYGITAMDSVGGHDGTLVGSAQFVADPQRGNVLNVSGVSGAVQFPLTEDLTPETGTVSIWVNTTGKQNADVVRLNTDMLVRCNLVGTYYAYNLRITDKGSAVAIISNDNPKTCGRQPQLVVKGPGNQVKLNQWNHLVMRWDGTSVSLFVNGKLASSARYSPTPGTGLSFHGNSPLAVAAAIWDFNDGYLEYNGNVSDLRVYSRALADSEITNIFQGQ